VITGETTCKLALIEALLAPLRSFMVPKFTPLVADIKTGASPAYVKAPVAVLSFASWTVPELENEVKPPPGIVAGVILVVPELLNDWGRIVNAVDASLETIAPAFTVPSMNAEVVL
jgi:hypothetical protein